MGQANVAGRYPFASTNPSSSATPPTYSNSTNTFPTIINNPTPAQGRYGHAAVYLTQSNLLYFIGGQIGNTGTAISNQILVFSLNSIFAWNSTTASNPTINTLLATGLPPNAWGVTVADSGQRTWSIGGIIDNCQTEGIIHVFDGEGWVSPNVVPSPPPRRRQAQGVSVINKATRSTDIWVFGGIAEPFTCSAETIGYLGYDRYSTTSTTTTTVDSYVWTTPSGAPAGYEPPVSDFTASLLAGGNIILFLGGQTSDGVLLAMNQLLFFTPATGVWVTAVAVGAIPVPRIGHVSVILASGNVLMQGGLSVDHETISDLSLLSPSIASVNSASNSIPWTWSSPRMSSDSLSTPARAWHSATLTSTGIIVVAFGIDTLYGDPSNDIMFLTINEVTMEYTWRSSYAGAAAEATRLAALALLNPKATSTPVQSAIASTSASTSLASAGTPLLTTSRPIASIASIAGSSVPKSVAATTSTKSASNSTPSSANSTLSAAQQSLLEAQAAAATKQNVIGGSVGAISAVIFLVLLFFGVKRYRNKQNARKIEESIAGMQGQYNGGPQHHPDQRPSFAGPLVSTLMYTRPKRGRALSLGSVDSGREGRGRGALEEHDFEEVGLQTNSISQNLPPGAGKGNGAGLTMHNNSSFSSKNVDATTSELGLVSIPLPTPPTSNSITSLSSSLSVASYPYLGGMLLRTASGNSEASHTSSRSDRSAVRPASLLTLGTGIGGSGVFGFLKKSSVWDKVMGDGLLTGAPSIRNEDDEDNSSVHTVTNDLLQPQHGRPSEEKYAEDIEVKEEVEEAVVIRRVASTTSKSERPASMVGVGAAMKGPGSRTRSSVLSVRNQDPSA